LGFALPICGSQTAFLGSQGLEALDACQLLEVAALTQYLGIEVLLDFRELGGLDPC
jgi:hypothetical protein